MSLAIKPEKKQLATENTEFMGAARCREKKIYAVVHSAGEKNQRFKILNLSVPSVFSVAELPFLDRM